MITVLLIDDDPELLEIISLELMEEGDFALQTSDSPAEAIRLALGAEFDSIVCDHYMPAMNGCSLLQLLRSHGCTAQLILYSGKEPDDEITRALASYLDIYIRRSGNPVSEFRELKEIIRTSYTKRNQPPC
jgi:CheY-like chemotaxis protein